MLGVDQIVDGAGRDQIQTGEWFVEQQRVVVLGDALCDEDPLSLASGEFCQVPVGKICHTELLQGCRHSFVIGSAESGSSQKGVDEGSESAGVE